MKARNTLTAGEVDALLADLARRLEGLGVETQPEVAARVLSLVSDPRAGLRQFAEVIKADAGLSGRLLRLANSAFFAQRQPVTSLDRACVLMGLDRLKAIALGFHLSRAAAADPRRALSRRVWGEGIYRACLSAELARQLCPVRAPEAFVVGLMMDAGLPLLVQLLGGPAIAILRTEEPPAAQFNAESANLPYTHVDVIAALARRWRLPDLIARPLERHHSTPPEGGAPDSVQPLHRVAYFVGSIRLDAACEPADTGPGGGASERLLGLSPERLAEIVKRAAGEYSAICDLFRDVADGVQDPQTIAEGVHRQLIDVIDRTLSEQVRSETRGIGGCFRIADQHVEIEIDRQGLAVAYLSDGEGLRLLSYAFRPGQEMASAVLDALGVEARAPDDTAELDAYLRSLAA
jgi:HD-like signal output (HDOD) protein